MTKIHPDLFDADGDRWVWIDNDPTGYSGYSEIPWTKEKIESHFGPVREEKPARPAAEGDWINGDEAKALPDGSIVQVYSMDRLYPLCGARIKSDGRWWEGVMGDQTHAFSATIDDYLIIRVGDGRF